MLNKMRQIQSLRITVLLSSKCNYKQSISSKKLELTKIIIYFNKRNDNFLTSTVPLNKICMNNEIDKNNKYDKYKETYSIELDIKENK
jgi:hypothetical protein